MVAGFTGFLQADGYAGFEALYHPARTRPGPIIEVACWAHCRRKFYDVWEATKSPVAREALDRIAAVYAIEDKARFAPAAERVEHRRETAPLLDAFFDWAGKTVTKLSGKLELAKVFRYTIARREALTRFVADGRLEADNNVAENAMRIIALGRKNYLFAEGRSRAKARGQHMGRPPKLTPQQQKEARRRRAEVATLKELAKSYNVGPATISRLG